MGVCFVDLTMTGCFSLQRQFKGDLDADIAGERHNVRHSDGLLRRVVQIVGHDDAQTRVLNQLFGLCVGGGGGEGGKSV